MLPCILLCGGKSSRVGTPKGLILTPSGLSWTETYLRSLYDVGISRVCVVIGYKVEEYNAEIEKIKPQIPIKIEVLVNPQPDLGQFSSLQVAATYLTSHFENSAAFVTLIDHPVARKETWKQLMSFSNQHSAVVPCYQGRGGHPVVLSRLLLNKICNINPLDEMARLDCILKENSLRCEVQDDSILLNLNTRTEWDKYLKTTL